MNASSETRTLSHDPGPSTDPDNPGKTKAPQGRELDKRTTKVVDVIGPETSEAHEAEEAAATTEEVNREPVSEPVSLIDTAKDESHHKSEVSIQPVPLPDDSNETQVTHTPEQAKESSKATAVMLEIVGQAEILDSKNLSQALHMALAQASATRPRTQAWMDITQELFTSIYVKAKGPVSRLSDIAKRLPNLKASETERLLDLFELLVVEGKNEWTVWRKRVVELALLAQRSPQSFENILWRAIGQEKVKKAEVLPVPLQGWINKVAGPGAKNKDEEQLLKKTFLFNTEIYTSEEISRLREVCEKQYGKFAPMKVRKGSDDEWRIVQGLVEGTIIAKQLPQFLKRIMKIDEQIRLVQTIRAQVEGCLVMHLKGESPIKEAFLSTKSIQESIATAAATRGSGSGELWRMVAQVKNISYDGGKHALYFHFYTREMAKKFDGIMVPFHRYDHRLYNLHREVVSADASAWKNQLDSNGERFTQDGFYACTLKNITRSVDLIKFSRFLKKLLGVDFQLDDLDKGGPFSDTSTAWELIVESDACPTALKDVRRIYWGHTMIIIEHPSLRGRKQCLRCGDIGHPMRNCVKPLAELLKSNCVEVKLQELKQYASQDTTFKSMEELRTQVDAVRENQEKALQVRENQEEKGETVSTDEGQAPVVGVTPDKSDDTRMNQTPGDHKEDSHIESQRQQSKSEWVTVKRFKGRGGMKSKADINEEKMNTTKIVSSLQRDIAKSTQNDDNKQDMHTENRGSAVTEATKVHSKKKKKDRRARQQEDEQSAIIFQKKAATLLMQEGKVKAFIHEAITQVDQEEGVIRPVRVPQTKEERAVVLTSISQVSQELGFMKTATPATGNCQVYAVCQALACSEQMGDKVARLEAMAKKLKEGCILRAQLDFDLKFPAGTRKPTLVELGRADDSMTSKESRKQFQDYLLEFASSSTKIDEIIPRTKWGCTDTLKTISTLLQREIYVISHPTGLKEPVLSHLVPETRAIRGKTFQTSGEYPMTVGTFYEKMRKYLMAEATDFQESHRPLILIYSGQHYSALLNGQRINETEDVVMKNNSDDEEFQEEYDEDSAGEHDQEGELASSHELVVTPDGSITSYGSQSPWDPEDWNGDYTDLIHRLSGPTIHHGLKCEIMQILRTRDPRMTELLHFLSDTVMKLSLEEQERLIQADLSDQDTCTKLQQHYQISRPILQQWYERVWWDHTADQGQLQLLDSGTSDSEYKDSENEESSQDSNESQIKVTPESKRICRREINAGKVEEMDIVPVQRELCDELMQNDSAPNIMSLSMDEFKTAWNHLLVQWEEHTGIPFPVLSSTKTLWLKVARLEGNRLLHLLKEVPGSHYILDSVHGKVLVELTKTWREQCWREVVEAGKREGLVDMAGVWFSEWENRFNVMNSAAQKYAVMNSSQEWAALRKIKYGGNAVLRLLAPRQMSTLANMLVSAYLFGEQIAALLGENYQETDTIVHVLQRHIRLMETNSDYAAHIEGVNNGIIGAWKNVFVFMYSAEIMELVGAKAMPALAAGGDSRRHY